MATIWIWNSIATRRRSASDTFVENGLGVLSAAVERAGHRVRLIDWARNDFYRTLTPAGLTRLARVLTVMLMTRPPGKQVCPLTYVIQRIMAVIQRRRMAAALRRLAREVADSGIRVFGMKVWYGEAFTWAKFLANEIRRRAPDVLLVAGGYHATLYEEDFLRHSPFDLAVISEGEGALVKILDVVDERAMALERTVLEADAAIRRRAIRAEIRYALARLLFPAGVGPVSGGRPGWFFSTPRATGERDRLLGRIREEIAAGRLTNVVYRDGDEIKKTGKTAGNINAKTVSFYGDMSGKVRLHVLIESAGCAWGKCHFCVHHHLEPGYLRRKVEKIVEEIRLMREQGIGLFRFAGSDTPPDFGAAIARGILESGLRLEYAMGSRAVRGAKHPEVYPDLVDKYALMIRSGLRAVFMGGETGHDVINDRVMNKGLGRDDLLWTIRALREAEKRVGTHVDISLAMIYPTPLVEGVTDEEVMASNLSLVDSARPDSVMVTPPGPFKNSEWFNRKGEFGFELDSAFVETAMEYEYVLYKPLELWPKLGIRQAGRDFVALLRECGRLRGAIERLGIPTDLSDEHFLMMRACGFDGREGARAFKRVTMTDIVSCDYGRLEELTRRTNARSRMLANGGRAGREDAGETTVPASLPLSEGQRIPARMWVQSV